MIIKETAAKARARQDLEELICVDGSPLPKAGSCKTPERLQAATHMELPTLERSESGCDCMVCGRKFSGVWVLRQHQVDTGHFNTDDPQQLLSRRERDAAAVAEAFDRLDLAMSEE